MHRDLVGEWVTNRHIHTKTRSREPVRVLGLGVCRMKHRKQIKDSIRGSIHYQSEKVFFICLSSLPTVSKGEPWEAGRNTGLGSLLENSKSQETHGYPNPDSSLISLPPTETVVAGGLPHFQNRS